jgi:hypothetical protein
MLKDQSEAIDLHQESYVSMCSHHSNLGLLKQMEKLRGSTGNQKQFQLEGTAFQIRHDSLQVTVMHQARSTHYLVDHICPCN